VSLSLALIASGIALAVEAVFVAHRALASDNFYSQYLAQPLSFFVIGVALLVFLSVLLVVAALRRSDALRAALMWGVSVDLVLLGLTYAFSLDTTGAWFLGAGVVGVVAAVLASIEAKRPLKTLGLSAIAVVALYAVNWTLARLFTAPFR
jgi:hypothetical protein